MSPCGGKGEGDGGWQNNVRERSVPKCQNAKRLGAPYVPLPFAVSCFTALASAMFSCRIVGARTATDIVHNGVGQAQVCVAGRNKKEWRTSWVEKKWRRGGWQHLIKARAASWTGKPAEATRSERKLKGRQKTTAHPFSATWGGELAEGTNREDKG